MKNFEIPEPCSENWNEMTPTQRGAFCQKCAIDVYDFTNKSGDEIRTILAQNIGGRVCGRLENVQLAELNSDFEAWKINNGRSYQRAWIFTLFVVFGLTLFSCEEENVAEKMQRVGQQILAERIAELEENKAESQEQITTKGEMVINGRMESNKHPKQSEIIKYETVGKIHMIERPQRVVELEEVEVAEHKYIEIYHTLGLPMMSDEFRTYLQETTPTESVSSETCTKMSGLMYPNPATNESTLKLLMPEKGKAVISLYSLNGQLIREIHSGRVSKGETEFQIDLSDLETGMYVVVIVSDNQKETVKFTKI